MEDDARDGPLPQGTVVFFSSLKAKLLWAAWNVVAYPVFIVVVLATGKALFPLAPASTGAALGGIAVWGLVRCRRMQLIANDSELSIRNKWRTVTAPWSSVEAVEEANTWWFGQPGRIWAVRLKGKRYPVLIAATLLTSFDEPRLRFILDYTGQAPDSIRRRLVVF